MVWDLPVEAAPVPAEAVAEVVEVLAE